MGLQSRSRRRFERLKCATDVTLIFRSDRATIEARLTDWSAAGAKLQLRAPFWLPHSFAVRRVTPSGGTLTVRCQLQWQDTVTAGIIFTP